MGSSPRVTRVGERALNEHGGIMLSLIGQSAALVGRRRLTELHALVVERQTQRSQKPSSQDMGVQVSPSAPTAPLAEWQTRRSQKPLSLRRAGSSPARGTNSRVWWKRKTQDA
jgi:hypothetical protein